jgi:hypothetical protein
VFGARRNARYESAVLLLFSFFSFFLFPSVAHQMVDPAQSPKRLRSWLWHPKRAR